MTDDNNRAGLLYQHSDDIEEANQSDDELDWDEPYPAHKLWVHRDIPYSAETLTDPDEFDAAREDCDMGMTGDLGFDCPTQGCDEGHFLATALKYDSLKTIDGLITCTSCDVPLLASRAPPEDWDYQTGWTGPTGGRP